MTIPSEDSRQVRSEICANCSAEFVASMSDVILIRTRVMMQMLSQRLVRIMVRLRSEQRRIGTGSHPYAVPMENRTLKAIFLPVGI